MKNFDSSNFETMMVSSGHGKRDLTLEKLVVDIKKLRDACTDYVVSHNKPNVTAVLAMSCIPTNIFANAKRQYICYRFGLKQSDEKVSEILKEEYRGLLTFDMLYDICASFELSTPIEEFLYKKEKAENEVTLHEETYVPLPEIIADMDNEFGVGFIRSAKASDLYTVVYLAVKNGSKED